MTNDLKAFFATSDNLLNHLKMYFFYVVVTYLLDSANSGNL